MNKIDNLLKNSGLPGPRGNLSLLHSFAKNATASEINECFSFYKDDLKNSPEEFVVMCGIVGFCILKKNDLHETLKTIRTYASHSSWRIREAVAIGIQEIADNCLNEIIDNLEKWLEGNELEKRAIVAALCEPKLLKNKSEISRILEILTRITIEFQGISGKLADDQNSLRKSLGYGWSVAIVSLPDEGKVFFKEISKNANKHIKWIVKENLRKKRLTVMDKKWVEKMLAALV